MFLKSAVVAIGVIFAPFMAHACELHMKPDVEISNPYARSSGPKAKVGAAFFSITNHSEKDIRLLAARSDVAARTEIHSHKMTGDGIMQMFQLEEGILIPAGATHDLKRGGDHVMLMGLKESLGENANVAVTLVFEKAGEMVVDIPVDLSK